MGDLKKIAATTNFVLRTAVALVQPPLLIGSAEDAKLTRGCSGLCQTTKDGGQFAKAEVCQYN